MYKLFLTLILTFTTFLQALDSPSFNLNTISGKKITIKQLNISKTEIGLEFKEFKEKAILLSLWGHRCPPCLKEIPEFISISNKHKDKIEIVAIESQHYPIAKLKEFVKDHGINYNVIAGIEHTDFINYISNLAGFKRGVPLPLLIAINKHGEVEQVRAGLIREDELEMLIEDLNE